jgi:hypothetical protein
VFFGGVLVTAVLSLVPACGSTDEKHPPPTIGDATVLERSGDGTATTVVP